MAESLEVRELKSRIAVNDAKTALAEAQALEITFRTGSKMASPWENRVYSFWTSVNRDAVFHCVETLGCWVNEDATSPVHIVFNTPGGSVTHGLALYDYIKQLQALGIRVTTSTVGMAASMGGILLQAGDERIMGANSFLLIHEVSSGAGGKTSEMEEELAFVKRLQERCVDILASRSNMTARQIKTKWKKTDWWLTADEALALGFVDAIR